MARKKASKKKTVKKTVKKKTARKAVKKTTQKKTVKKKEGRSTAYKASYADMAMGFAEDGSFTARTLAKKFGVSPQTILNWKRDHSNFSAAIDQGREIAVDDIENAFFQLAKGGLKKRKVKKTPDGITTERETLLPHAQACNKILEAHRKQYKSSFNLETDGTSFVFNVVKKYNKPEADND